MTEAKKRYERRRDRLRRAYRTGRLTRGNYLKLLNEAVNAKVTELETGDPPSYASIAKMSVIPARRSAQAKRNMKASPIDFAKLHAKYAKRMRAVNKTAKKKHPARQRADRLSGTVRIRHETRTHPTCGTVEGFSEHIRRKETRCQACIDAVKENAAKIRAERAAKESRGEYVYQRTPRGILDLHIHRTPDRVRRS